MIELLTEQRSVTTAVAGAMGVTAIYIALFSLFRYLSTPRFDAPLELYRGGVKDKHHFMSLHWVLNKHYQRYKDSFWKIVLPHGEMIVLPLRYVDELRNLPEDKISFIEENEDRFHASLTGMSARSSGGADDTSQRSIRHDLTRHLSNLMPDIWDETVYAFASEVGDCSTEWKEVNIYRLTTQLVALISGRVFAGPELSRDPDYVRAIIDYTIHVFTAAGALDRYPWFLRRLAANWLVPEMRKVRRAQRDMERIMAPVLEKRRAELAAGKAPEYMTTWNLRNSPPNERDSITVQASLQLRTSMAAVHTTSMQTSHVIFDLAARPEYVAPLRAELESAVAEFALADSASSGKGSRAALDKRSMPKLRKLDSFMKESQRLNPLGLLTFQRKIMSDITLHDGTVLKAKSHICIPSSSHAKDPARFENPEAFDGFRFATMRELPGQATRHQYVETGVGPADITMFGHGTHACPGRFFAGNEIKVIMSYLLQNYDFKLKDGEERPKNIYTDGGMRPDPTVGILVRKRKTA